MRTIGEMAVTTSLHANLPRNSWGHAVLHAINVINRTADNAENNAKVGAPPPASRLEKWKGKQLPGQMKGIYPFGCLAFKHIPSKLRASKMDAHAQPMVYLGLDPNCRAYRLGTRCRLEVSVAVEVTFVENVFPFRKVKHRESPSSLLWRTDNNLEDGDARLGMFTDPPEILKILDQTQLKTIGALPDDEGQNQTPPFFSSPFMQTNQQYRVPEQSPAVFVCQNRPPNRQTNHQRSNFFGNWSSKW